MVNYCIVKKYQRIGSSITVVNVISAEPFTTDGRLDTLGQFYPYTYQGLVNAGEDAQESLAQHLTQHLSAWRSEVLRDSRIEGETARMEVANTQYEVTEIIAA